MLGKTNLKMDKQYRKARVWSNQELKRFSHLFTGDIVNVSAGDDIDKEGSTYKEYFYNAKTYTITNYGGAKFRGFQARSGEIELDLTSNLPEELKRNFDTVFNHTTLEHIFDFKTAFHYLCELSKDVIIIIVPFCQVQHENEGYLDYWRFTPTSIRKMFQDEGCQVIYEVANNDFNTSVYLLFVASRKPEIWIEKMPSYFPLKNVANWVGCEPNVKEILNLLTSKFINKFFSKNKCNSK